MAGSVSRCLGTVVAIICITWCGVASTTDQGHQEAGSFISSTWDTFQNTSTLYKRDDYEDCRRKGEAVQCILNGRSPNPPGSPWTDYAVSRAPKTRCRKCLEGCMLSGVATISKSNEFELVGPTALWLGRGRKGRRTPRELWIVVQGLWHGHRREQVDLG